MVNNKDLIPSSHLETRHEQQQELRYQGSKDIKPGQFLWRFNMTTGELSKVELVTNKTIDFATLDQTKVSRVEAKKDELYVCAINQQNAMRKILKMFGWRWDKKTRAGVPLFPEVKGESQIIELNRADMKTENESLNLQDDLEAIKAVAVEYAKKHGVNYNVIILNGDPQGDFIPGESTYEFVRDSYFLEPRPNAKLLFRTDDLLNGPAPQALSVVRDDPDETSDHTEPFEDDGAYADDDKDD